MQVLSSRIDSAAFLERIPVARERVLMLDYDGTLAPLEVRPERAIPYPGVLDALEMLIRDDATRIVIVSGRCAQDVAPLLTLTRQPEIWGAHGWERLLPSGELRTHEPSHTVKLALDEAEVAVREFAASGSRLERKRASIALHWRGLPPHSVGKILEGARTAWIPFTRGGALRLLHFDGGIELCAQGRNKQHPVKVVLSETAADSAIAYLGDDITDEDAFAAVKPRGLAVLVRPELRETQADIWLQSPRELIAFLTRWCVSSLARV
jgi:trehalose-phosphatase